MELFRSASVYNHIAGAVETVCAVEALIDRNRWKIHEGKLQSDVATA